MVIYKCETCSKIFDKKCNYDRHLMRKNKCSSIIVMEPIKKVLNLEEVELETSDETYICDFCDKSFKNKNYFKTCLG